MRCRRCGTEDVNPEEVSRIAWFDGAKPTEKEMREFWEGAGLYLCEGCGQDYLEWIEESPPSVTP